MPYVRCVTHVAKGSHTGLTGASICMKERDGSTPLTTRALRGQLDLIALREHVCWSKLVVQLGKGGAAICRPVPLKPTEQSGFSKGKDWLRTLPHIMNDSFSGEFHV